MNRSSDAHVVNDKKVLISGGGIAGLTLGILLKENGWDPLVIERDHALRTEGYLLFFFGTGWDVAERMGIAGDIMEVRYPIDSLEYVDRDGNPIFPAVPIDRLRRALGGKYAFLRRQDLEGILFNRSLASGVPIRFGTTIQSVHEGNAGVNVTFNDGTSDTFRLVFGADGVHSRVRELLFGQESQFDRFLGYYAAAFHASNPGYDLRRSLSLYEEPGRVVWCYPVDDRHMDVLYIFRHDSVGRLPHEKRLAFVREQLKGCVRVPHAHYRTGIAHGDGGRVRHRKGTREIPWGSSTCLCGIRTIHEAFYRKKAGCNKMVRGITHPVFTIAYDHPVSSITNGFQRSLHRALTRLCRSKKYSRRL